jgi:hypothetical protein
LPQAESDEIPDFLGTMDEKTRRFSKDHPELVRRMQ